MFDQFWAFGGTFWINFWVVHSAIHFASIFGVRQLNYGRVVIHFGIHFGRPGGWLRGSILDQFWALNFGIIFRRPADLCGAFAGLEHCDENMLTRVNRAMAFEL